MFYTIFILVLCCSCETSHPKWTNFWSSGGTSYYGTSGMYQNIRYSYHNYYHHNYYHHNYYHQKYHPYYYGRSTQRNTR